MRINLGVKISLTLFVLIFTISFIIAASMHERMVAMKVEELRASLLMLARVTATLIDGEKHKDIPLSAQGVYTDEYVYIQQKLRRIKRDNPLIKYIYTLANNDDGTLCFVVDAASRDELFSYPGEIYNTQSLDISVKDFLEAHVVEDIVTDETGDFVSGYAPIYDEAGNRVAIVGVDMLVGVIADAKTIMRRTFMYVFGMSIFLSLLLGSLVALRITFPIKKLLEGTRVIAGGNLEYQVAVHSNDEVGELATSFNAMARSLQQSYKELKLSFLNAIHSLTVALEAKDAYTKGHSERVAQYCVAIAHEMRIPEDDIQTLEDLAIMHDIGKIGIQENILNKPTRLTDDERTIIEQHPAIGEDILKPITFLDPALLQLIRSHHERPDGKGYPDGLTADEIPILVSILTVADAYDAMATDRPYRKAMSQTEALKELLAHTDKQYDRRVVEALQQAIQKGAL